MTPQQCKLRSKIILSVSLDSAVFCVVRMKKWGKRYQSTDANISDQVAKALSLIYERLINRKVELIPFQNQISQVMILCLHQMV